MLLWAGLLLAGGPAWAAKPLPLAPAYFIHNEGVVSGETEKELARRLYQVEARTGRQFVVGLFQSLEGEDLEGYTNRLFKAWKVGDARRNDGLLFCLFRDEKRWRVEVGYGLEGTLTDLESAEIARAAAESHFQSGDLDGGVLAAVEGLSAKLEGGSEASARRGPVLYPGDLLRLLLYFLLGLFLIFWPTYERGFHWGLDDYGIGKRADAGPRYPLRVAFLLWLYILFLFKTIFWLLYYSGNFRGGRYSGGYGGGGGGSWSGGGGYSGGGGSSGGGGASGGW